MSATAFQRARREAAATMRAAAESVQKENDYTAAELKAMCNEKGIEYKAKATKAELIELLGM